MGKGISYGAARSEASSVHGLDVHIVGAGNSAGQAALFFATHARSVTILCRGAALEKSMSQLPVDQVAAQANVAVRHMTRSRPYMAGPGWRRSTCATRRPARPNGSPSGGLFVFIGADAETAWLPPEIATDHNGYVLTGPDVPVEARAGGGRDPYLLETSVPGIFACGDVRYSPVKRVAAAVGEGSMAIAFVHQYLRDEATVSTST